MKILATCLLALTSYFAEALPARVAVQSPLVGEITLSCIDEGNWTFEASETMSGDGVEIIDIVMKVRDRASVPPEFTVSMSLPQKDIHNLWHGSDECQLKPNWGGKYNSQISRNIPLYAFIGDNDRNRLTITSDEALRFVSAVAGLREEGSCIIFSFGYFSTPEPPASEYRTSIRLDARDIFWGKAVSEASEWITVHGGFTPMNVPEQAYEPLYSSWYQFHQDVHQADLERECALASQLGMKTIIVDDGWQVDNTKRGYSYCGDWKVSTNRFQDMKEHVANIHRMGMKYMMWYALPFIGPYTENYDRFKDKFLGFRKEGVGILDPRFPEVRAFLTDLLVRAMKEYDLDGFKIDFIDSMFIEKVDPAIAQNYAGRDIKSVTEAVNVLMKGIREALEAIKPDVLIEFRQRYIGPAIRQYGNMFRASDCPADKMSNRIRTANLRLTSGSTAVHSDMLEWHPDTDVRDAAEQILSVMFSTVQYSMMLSNLPEDHLRMIRHWMGFMDRHSETLLHGRFLPHHPESNYPLIEAMSASERIVAVYQDGMVVPVGKGYRDTYVVNATSSDTVFVNLESKPSEIEVFDTFGNPAYSGRKLGKGPGIISIPSSGYARISCR